MKENIFDCNAGKMQIFPYFENIFLAVQVLALGMFIFSGSGVKLIDNIEA